MNLHLTSQHVSWSLFSVVLCSFASAFNLRMDDYLEDIGAEVEINPVEVEYYDSSAAVNLVLTGMPLLLM